MPIQIRIEDKTKAIEKLAYELSDKNITIANVRAINTAIRKSNTLYRREIVKNYNLKYADTKSIVIPKRATYTETEGTISGNIKPISLSHFNPSFIKGGSVFSIKSVKNKQSGKRELSIKSKKARKKDQSNCVTVEIRKGEKKTLPFAFMINSDKPGLSKQIWARGKYVGNEFKISKGRMPITALKTAAPFGMMTGEATQKEIEIGATESMEKEFERQVKMLLQRAGAR